LKYLPIYLANRCLKIIGNLAKHLLGHPFHWMFPQKRFCIPKHAAPLWTANKSCLIPRTVWLTNFTNRVSFPVYLNYLVNRLLAPAYTFRFMDDADMQQFIEKNCSAVIYQDYLCLKDGAAKADLWRLLVLHKHGGVYADIDSHLVWPLGRSLKPDDDELYLRSGGNSLTNYFIASKANHPNLKKIIAVVRRNIKNRKQTFVWGLTGPGPMIEALSEATVHSRASRFVSLQGTFTNEYFQYLDKPNGKWTHTKEADILNSPPAKNGAA
jgi:mannosyltransferase OCH1-like enzyme